jgi:hypothetical protein
MTKIKILRETVAFTQRTQSRRNTSSEKGRDMFTPIQMATIAYG